MKGSNYNGNQNSIKFSKKQLTFNTERTEKVLIGFTSKLSFKVKHTDTEQADIFRTKARYIHLFFANGKADSTKDFNSKDKHGTEDYSNKNINDKNEHSGKDFNSQEATTTKSTSAASNKNCDTFTYTSPAAKTAVKLTQKGTVSAQKNTKVNQTKTAVKNNASNKIAVSGSLSKNKTKSAQNTVPDGLKLHLKHTTDPKQKAAMQKTMKNISNGISSEKADNSSPIIPNDYTSPRVTSNVKGLQENTPLTPKLGRVWGPAGEETFYNMVMNRENGESVIGYMREAGFSEKDYPYWVRDDGVKMLGDYVVVAANLDIRPRGSVIDTSLGKALICDIGSFTEENPEQIDIAVNWGKCTNGTDSFYKTDPRKKS